MKSSVWGPRALMAKLTRELSALSLPHDVVHPGVGSLSESLEFSKQCEASGKLFIGSPPRTLSMVRNRVAFLNDVESLGIRHAYVGLEPLRSLREVSRFYQEFRSPFRLRALTPDPLRRDSFSVRSEHDLESSLLLWMDEVIERCPEALVLPVRPMEGMRRIVLPFARYSGGLTQFFPALENSLDLRGEPVLEALAHPWVDGAVLENLRQQSHRILERAHFVGLGALEFWIDGSRSFFVNATAGLTPGYELWETAAGTSAAEWGYLIATGSKTEPQILPESLWSKSVLLRGYLRAEDSFRGIPHPGLVRSIDGSPNVDWSSNLNALPSELKDRDTSLLGVMSVQAQTWAGALERLSHGLSKLWVSGMLQTNEGFIGQVTDHPWVREGLFHAAFLDEEFVPEVLPPAELSRLALREVVARKPAQTYWKAGERVFSRAEVSEPQATPILPDLRVEWMGTLGDKHRVRVGPWYVDVMPLPNREPSTQPLLSPCAGEVHALWFREGAHIEAHSTLAVVKSMGRLVGMALSAPMHLERWLVKSGDPVKEGQPLGELSRGP